MAADLKIMKPWAFYLILVGVLALGAFGGFAVCKWMLNDPSKLTMCIGVGVLIAVVIDAAIWYFLKDKVDWAPTSKPRAVEEYKPPTRYSKPKNNPLPTPKPLSTLPPPNATSNLREQTGMMSINNEDTTSRFMRNFDY